MNIDAAQDLFESEIFRLYGPSAVNISRKESGYLDYLTDALFQHFYLDIDRWQEDWFRRHVIYPTKGGINEAPSRW